ncbi:hypothetical protein DMH26_00900 [Streptomyces sp. WAC 05379]|nr:hypothetical protein DMH26_00900 [Streptomyces sp. WAC 05379]
MHFSTPCLAENLKSAQTLDRLPHTAGAPTTVTVAPLHLAEAEARIQWKAAARLFAPITPSGSGCLHVGLVVDALGYRVEWLIVAGEVAERSGAGSEICRVHVVVELNGRGH